MKRITRQELDKTAARLEEIRLEEEQLRAKLLEQVQEFGSVPTHAEKSRRLYSDLYQFTVTQGTTIEIKDAEVIRIQQICPTDLFDQLFRPVTKFKLVDSATLILAGQLPTYAPRNLRTMFSRAVTIQETAPKLRIEKLECNTLIPAS